jgi:hypothetical protein
VLSRSLRKPASLLKLKAARERKRASGMKVEGRKIHTELRPGVVALAKHLRRKRPKGGQRSLREISWMLAETPSLQERGRILCDQRGEYVGGWPSFPALISKHWMEWRGLRPFAVFS